jgi:hypothetical protein
MASPASIFVSHPHADDRLAKELQCIIFDVFGNAVTTFVSSDISNLPAGAIWRDELKRQLSASKVLVVLCSPDFIDKPWLHFEVGAAWILGLPIIPVCHSGMKTNDLPSQFSAFSALHVNDPQFSAKYSQSIAQHCGMAYAHILDTCQYAKRIQTITATRQAHKFDLFISCPMSSLSEDEYRKTQPHIAAACDELREKDLASRIYFSAYDKTSPTDFDHPYFGSSRDFAALAESDRFILIYPKRCASGCLAEAGFAISKRIPSVFFVRDPNDLPYNLAATDVSQGVLKHSYESLSDIKNSIVKHWAQLFPTLRE